MPRAKKTEKFFYYLPRRSGYWKNRILIGVNCSYEGKKEEITLKDLNDFLKEKNIDPSKIKIGKGFSISADV